MSLTVSSPPVARPTEGSVIQIQRWAQLPQTGWGPFKKNPMVYDKSVASLVAPQKVTGSYDDALAAAKNIADTFHRSANPPISVGVIEEKIPGTFQVGRLLDQHGVQLELGRLQVGEKSSLGIFPAMVRDVAAKHTVVFDATNLNLRAVLTSNTKVEFQPGKTRVIQSLSDS